MCIRDSSTGGWFSFTNTDIEGVVLEEGEHSLKIHFNSSTPVNIISLNFEKTGEISSAPFTSISGKTASDEKSLEIFLNQEILTSSIEIYPFVGVRRPIMMSTKVLLPDPV